MDKLLAEIAAENDVGRAIDLAAEEARRVGVRAATFHIAAPQASQVGPKVYVAMFGFNQEWMRAYRDPAIRQHDPVPDYVMRAGRAMVYREVLQQVTLNEEQASFMARVDAEGLMESMGIPIYGPFDFDTYFTFNLGRPVCPDDDELLHHLIALVEVCNRRLGQLMEEKPGTEIALSERESEVLNWIGRSKSNGDVATILGVSPATVDTYVRRIFAKLETNDRVAAVIKGIRLGLIRY